MFLSDVSIRRPVFATMLMVALVVLGVVSYQRLAIDEYPDVTYPVVIAQTSWSGASAESMERDVSRPIEEALNTVQGIDELSSTNLEGISIVRLRLKLGVDVADAQQDVQSKVARIRRSLPRDIDDPVIQHFDPNDRPIMSIAIQSTDRPVRDLTDLAEQTISTRIEAVQGVGGVNVVGGASRQIRVELKPDAMRSYGVSPAQVAAALQAENQEVPAGRVTRGSGERLVRVMGRVEDPREFASIPVVVRGGVPVLLGEVADVRDATADVRSAALMNDTRAVSLDILKVSGSNTVEVADGVRAAVDELRRQLPEDVRISVIRDDSHRIRESLADVQLTILLGAVLTIAIIYLFLNSWRSTVITGLTLPVSIISAFFVMWMFGFTVNTMTLLALSLAIGLLIDDAIVVRENIVRHIEMGKDHHRAAREGTSEIGLAVTSTSLAVIAVFVPVAFMGGMIGKIFMQFGVTVAFAVLVSLFVSFTLDPMLSSVWPDPEVEHGAAHGHGAGGRRKVGPIRRFAFWFNDRFEVLADRYPHWLKWSLHHRWKVMGGAGLSVVLAWFILGSLGFTWMPDFDGGEFNVGFRTPPGSSLEYTVGRGQDVAKFLRRLPEVDFTYLSVGGGFRGTPNNGSIYVKLKPAGERNRTQQEIQTELRGKLRQLPGVRASVSGSPSIFQQGSRQPIIVNVQGPEERQLKMAANQVLEAIRSVPGTAEPQSSDEGDLPQLNVTVNREQAAAAGLGIESVASVVQPLFSGQRAGTWEDPQGYAHDVVVVYPDSMRTSAADVRNLAIPGAMNPATGQAALVPLSQIAQVTSGVGPQQIERRSLERMVSVSAGVLPGYSLGDVAAAVEAKIGSLGLPAGYHAVFTGDVQNLNETKGYVGEALLLAVVFIYLILASLFGSFLQPLAIMLALPLSFIGVGLGLWTTRGNLNVMSMIGIIMLMGLVVKNGILLVDFVNQDRERGVPREEAILSAARTRLRPIVMTTMAMIFGMIPLALALGEGAEQRAPMAHAVIGGLITSTALTLFVVPVVYTLFDDFVARLRRGRRVHVPALAEGPRVAIDEPELSPVAAD
ncbi:efflux RND transporter permease subunit [Longimicrobium sp.]|uniref:efflux RND transporter permease subunit n=1 Tax=Longimicrobium sp. TaxID=2029185 RepID=UPI002C8BDE65|nr:efflux RND transporter permease subunit [Longimicrobium sp.]HSU12848.1 efflux RND transporter permease subunit [Longimicrobium sp.]